MTLRYFIVIIIVAILFPFPTTIVPTWRLKVIENSGNTCPKKEVTQTWAHYSIYINSGNFQTESRLTDEQGYVEFPKRTVWSPLIWRIIGSIIANVLTLAHGSAGAKSNVYSSGLKDVAWISYKPYEPLEDIIPVNSCVFESNQ